MHRLPTPAESTGLSTLARRDFLRSIGFCAAAICTSAHARAEDPTVMYRKAVPVTKNLDPRWIASLVTRGHDLDAGLTVSKRDALPHIGMTAGGLCSGTVYLSGDGRLFVWDIFNKHHEGVVAQTAPVPEGMKNIADSGPNQLVRERDGASFIAPPTPDKFPNPFRQEFRLREGDKTIALDASAWKDVTFTGQWPLGTVVYRDPSRPYQVTLRCWTPFIPLDVDASSYPATVVEIEVKNTGDKALELSVEGLLENPALINTRQRQKVDLVSRELGAGPIRGVFHSANNAPANLPDSGTMVLATTSSTATVKVEKEAVVASALTLAPGASQSTIYLLAWHFANTYPIPKLGVKRHHYAKRFTDAEAVATDLAKRMPELRGATMDWVATWNDSTLPQWLLDRTILTTNTLQTTNCFRFDDGRFWAWEGIGACAGTCTHVWHYMQGMAHLFPELERNLREVTDFGVAQNPDGSVNFRAESGGIAIDGQCGIVLRTYREHRMSKDGAFLKRVYPGTKKALEWLIAFDEKGRGGLDGLLDGMQHNTLDAEWYGKVHCLCSLYLAALRSGEEMAKATGDADFAKRCREIFETGRVQISKILYRSDFGYFIQDEDPAHANAIGVGQGCEIDQVIGQFWAHENDLGAITDPAHVRSALNALWKHNFVPEIGSFRQIFNLGRFYAMPGDAGLVMCTWPNGGLREDSKKHWQYAYFNECMTGFEWQVAAHMIREGAPVDPSDRTLTPAIEQDKDPRALTLRGLAIARAIHDRYGAEKRNPYNEIECSDHYARAGASYAVFLAACGFSYDGPNGILGFAPKIQPENFRAPFTVAEGWGGFAQQRDANGQSHTIELKRGQLALKTLVLSVPGNGKTLAITLDGKAIPATLTRQGDGVMITFKDALTLHAGQKLVAGLAGGKPEE